MWCFWDHNSAPFLYPSYISIVTTNRKSNTGCSDANIANLHSPETLSSRYVRCEDHFRHQNLGLIKWSLCRFYSISLNCRDFGITDGRIKIIVLSNATTCPCGRRGPPSWAWQQCNRLLRLGHPWGAVTLSRWCEWWYRRMSVSTALKPNFY